MNKIFSLQLALTLALVHFVATLCLLFVVFAHVFDRTIGGFAAVMRGARPAPPPAPPVTTGAEATLSILVQPLRAILRALDIKSMPAYLALNSLLWGAVLALLIGLLYRSWRWAVTRPPADSPGATDQTASEQNDTSTHAQA